MIILTIISVSFAVLCLVALCGANKRIDKANTIIMELRQQRYDMLNEKDIMKYFLRNRDKTSGVRFEIADAMGYISLIGYYPTDIWQFSKNTPSRNIPMSIKFFRYGTQLEREYAVRCAEELRDKLTEEC